MSSKVAENIETDKKVPKMRRDLDFHEKHSILCRLGGRLVKRQSDKATKPRQSTARGEHAIFFYVCSSFVLIGALAVGYILINPPSNVGNGSFVFYDLSGDPQLRDDLPTPIRANEHIADGDAFFVLMPECGTCSYKSMPKLLQEIEEVFGRSTVLVWSPDSKSDVAGQFREQIEVSRKDWAIMAPPWTPRPYYVSDSGSILASKPDESMEAFARRAR